MRLRRPLTLTTLLAAAAMLAAGCGGGGSSPGIASVTSSTTTNSPSSGAPPTPAQLLQTQREVTRFARCIRSHGVSNFPDPTVAPHAFKDAMSNPSPAFQSAYTVCGHLLPAGRSQSQNTTQTRAQTVALLAFARCLRSHGLPRFPDPTSAGELSHQMLAQAGINLHGPGVVQAADTCTSVTHGVITRAIVARFVAGQ